MEALRNWIAPELFDNSGQSKQPVETQGVTDHNAREARTLAADWRRIFHVRAETLRQLHSFLPCIERLKNVVTAAIFL